MPSLDGGHYFLTALIPLHTHPCRVGEVVTSPSHAVRELLARTPTAQHSPACAASGLQSPFAASPRTHFARFAVVDDPAFNGRDTADAIGTAAQSLVRYVDLLQPQPVDRLPRPYLLFAADFDLIPGEADPVAGYLAQLWACMGTSWAQILEHCEGYVPAGERGFVDYLRSCQIDTTMPFNDYGAGPAAPAKASPALVLVAVVAVVVLLAALVLTLRLTTLPLLARWAAGLVIGALAAVAAAVALVFRLGPRSAPYSPGADLKTVLKALYVQSAFARFAAEHQGCDPATLQAAFAAFVAATRPGDLDGPTQTPGVVPQAQAGS